MYPNSENSKNNRLTQEIFILEVLKKWQEHHEFDEMYYGQDMYFNLHHTFVDVRPVYRYFKAFKDTMSEKNVSTYRYCEDTLRKKYLDTTLF